MAKRKPEQHKSSGTKLYIVWYSMLGRCYTKSSTRYEYYGAKGVTVCEEWRNSFLAFKKFALENGYKEGLQIDRIDNNKGYSPDNCRFITHKENNNNRTNHFYVDIGNHEVYTLSQLSEKTGINRMTLYSRIKTAKTVKELLRPVQKYTRKIKG
ncbi:hypothetical protein P4644_16160 [Priestia aryabhattai]|uniref:hypothetical protein n=1 Tax=Priestia aryabhattai TaxID=412384 RepID=UPI002E1E54B4|nr:hypothetical protein [Priestia aryabhattai]